METLEDEPEGDQSKEIGEIVLYHLMFDQDHHDDFIDNLDRSIKYPEDAP